MFPDFKIALEKMDLTMNLSKTNILTTKGTPVYVGINIFERVKDYVYLGHQIKLGKENHQS